MGDSNIPQNHSSQSTVGGIFIGASVMFILMGMAGTCYGDLRYRDAICKEEMLHVAKTGADSLHILHDHGCPISLIDRSLR